MSLTPSQQYYLQSMDIDLYVARPSTSTAQQHSEKPSEVRLSELAWIEDLCLCLDTELKQVKQQSTQCYELGSLVWQFDTKPTKTSFKEDRLRTGPLQQLNSAAAKKALWACICNHLDNSTADKSQ